MTGRISLQLFPWAMSALASIGFSPTAHAISTRPLFAVRGAAAADTLGGAIAIADFDGDGHDDVLIGAPGSDASGANSGSATIHFGARPTRFVDQVVETNGPPVAGTGPRRNVPIEAVALVGFAAGHRAGSAVAAGDLNGDGYADAFVGAPGGGRVLVYYGSPNFDGTADLTLIGNALDAFGGAVAAGADVDGDGFGDAVVGSPMKLATKRGGFDVYLGGATPDAVSDLAVTGVADGEELGTSLTVLDLGVYVGAPENDAVATDAGRVYVYRGGQSLDATPDLVISGMAAADRFGSALAVTRKNNDGIVKLLVAAPGDDALGSNCGRVYQFNLGPGMDAAQDGTAGDSEICGSESRIVIVTGDVNNDGTDDVVLGMANKDAPGANSGAVYAYFGPTYAGPYDLAFPGRTAGDGSGYAVATGDVDGDGFFDVFYEILGSTGAGMVAGHAVYAYQIISPNGGEKYWDNVSLPISWRGHDLADLAISSDGGATWTTIAAGVGGQETNLITTNGDIYGVFDPVRLLLRVSARGQTPTASNSHISSGPFLVVPSTPPPAAAQKLQLNIAGANDGAMLGTSVAAIGDVNEDGFEDFALGAPGDVASGQARGRVHVYFGGPGLDQVPDLSLDGEGPGDMFGRVVVGAGDLNGDGIDDLAVAATLNDAGGADAGRVYLFFGGVSMNSVADVTLTGEAPGDQFGESVTSAWHAALYRDIDISGVVVGAPYHNGPAGADAGRAYYYEGGQAMDNVADATFDGTGAGDLLGTSVALFNPDRQNYGVGAAQSVLPDAWKFLVVGAPGADGGGDNAGEVRVFASVLPDAWKLWSLIRGTRPGAMLGEHVMSYYDPVGANPATRAGPGDMRGTTVSSSSQWDQMLAISTRGAIPGRNGPINIFGLTGNPYNADAVSDPGAAAPTADVTIPTASLAFAGDDGWWIDDYLGSLVHIDTFSPPSTVHGDTLQGWWAGDPNGDGRPDLAIGFPYDDQGGTEAGSVLIAPGRAGLILTGGLNTNLIGQPGEHYGYSVALADLNGDGFDDLIVGAPMADVGGPNRGRVEVRDFKRYHLHAPMAAETWTVGALKTVRWAGAEPATGLLSVDGGATYRDLFTSAGGRSLNSVQVRVPHTPTRFARLKLVPADPSVTGSAESESLFTIESSIALLSFTARPVEQGVSLAWSSDPGPGAEGIAGYRLYRRDPGTAADGVRIGPDLITETGFTDRDGRPGALYRLGAVNGLGEELEIGRIELSPGIIAPRVWPSPVVEGGALQVAFAAPLGSAGYPASDLDVGLFEVSGRRIATLARGQLAPENGAVTVRWTVRDVAAGIYFVRVTAPSAKLAFERKVVIMP